MIPIDIKFKSIFVPLDKYESEQNEATGEIRLFNYRGEHNNLHGKRVLCFTTGYDEVWFHLGRKYYKQVSRFKTRTC